MAEEPLRLAERRLVSAVEHSLGSSEKPRWILDAARPAPKEQCGLAAPICALLWSREHALHRRVYGEADAKVGYDPAHRGTETTVTVVCKQH